MQHVTKHYSLTAVKTLWSEIYGFVTYTLSKEELPQHWRLSVIIPIYKKIVETECNYGGISLVPATYIILTRIFSQGWLHVLTKLFRIIIVDFSITNKLLIIYSGYMSDTGEAVGV